MKHFKHDDGMSWTDLFCGAGGSSTGLVEAGGEVKLAANHWDVAIDTHSANHPGTEHLCANINILDMRRLPRTRGLWASVICTEISPAGGKKRTRGQLALMEYGSLKEDAFQLTRATALDVIRATEVHRYDVVVVENVVEFITDWELFGWWRKGMHMLGYRSQIISVSSAHVGDDDNEAAAQWRNRVYIQFSREGVPLPDLAPRPLAWCPVCGRDVHARQAWNAGRKVGGYRDQYVYVCPNRRHRGTQVEPYINPASSIINWDDLGQRIGDRPLREFFADKARTRSLGFHHLAPNTMRKIRDGLAAYWDVPSLITVSHGKDGSARAVPVHRAPLPTRTKRIGDGVLIPPGAFIAELRGGGSTHRPVTHPLATIAANGNHHGLVIPYRRGCDAYPTGSPLHTLSTRDSAGLLQPSGAVPDVEDCYFRMIKPREQLRAQRFPGEYIVRGNVAEQTMQAGNAVSVNVANWIGRRVTAALEGVA